MKQILLISSLFTCLMAAGQNSLNLVPVPAKLEMGKGSFRIDPNTHIVLEGSGLEKNAAFLNDQLLQFLGYKLNITKDPTQNSCDILVFVL